MNLTQPVNLQETGHKIYFKEPEETCNYHHSKTNMTIKMFKRCIHHDGNIWFADGKLYVVLGVDNLFFNCC